MHVERGAYRRVIASPRPLDIIELDSIRLLMKHGVVVICAGGGGVPVVQVDGKLQGIEAVVDKDRTSALLAKALHADRFIILTDVAGVYAQTPDPTAAPIQCISAARLQSMAFPAGSMGPKVEAVCDFVLNTGAGAAIGHLDALAEIVKGVAGTHVTSKESKHGVEYAR